MTKVLSFHDFAIMRTDLRSMAFWTGAIRLFFALVLSIYMGGFTFYSVVVIPVLHDHLESSFETGLVTQRVTDVLNLLGVVTLLLGWCIYGLDARWGFRHHRPGRWQIWPLSISSACLLALLLLHRVMDRKLEAGATIGFYPYHRAYLWTSTVQWFANLWLLAGTTGVFTPSQGSHR
jgi:hypothetical protein